MKCHTCGHTVGQYTGGYVWGHPFCGTHIAAELASFHFVNLERNKPWYNPPRRCQPAGKGGELRFCAAGTKRSKDVASHSGT